jgi:anthranilate phosphoribosyltransferase
MKHAMPTRRELGIRTLFNCLGPLANPAGATHQLLGAYDDKVRPLLADALRELGSTRAWIVRSTDGMDELSPHAPTRVTVLDHGSLSEIVVAPEDFGLPRSPAGAIQGGEPSENAGALTRILAGEPHPARDAILLNAAAGLVVALGLEPRQAADRVREALDSGAARQKLETWRRTAESRRPTAGTT